MTFSETLKETVRKAVRAAGPTLRRFWSSMALSIALTVTTILNMSRQGAFPQENLTKVSLSLLAGILVSWCVILYLERKSQESSTSSSYKYNLIALGVSLVISGLLYLMLNGLTFVTEVRHVALCASLFLLFLVIGNLKKEKGFEMYLVRLFLQAVVAGIFSGVVFLGLSGAVFTVSSLFSLEVLYDFYLKLFVGVFGILGSFLFMSGIPEPGEDISYDTYPKILKSLMVNVVIPLFMIYAAILLVYFAKILITWQWPVGLVSNLVIWYALIGTGVFFFVQPLTEENRWAEIFSKYFPIVLIPLLAMMFVSMGIRVKYYGITESRYYVLLAGIWLLGSMLHLIFSKQKKNPMLLLTLAILVALSSVGPWSAFSVSKWSQNRRLESICAKYDMVQEGTLVPQDEVSPEDKKEIAAILTYFDRYHKLQDVKVLPEEFTLEAFQEVFGFPYDPYGHARVIEIVGPEDATSFLDVTGYNYLFQFRSSVYREGPQVRFSQGDVSVEYDMDKEGVIIYFRGNKEWYVSLNDYITEIAGKSEVSPSIILEPEDMVIQAQTDHLKIKVVMTRLYGGLDPATGKVEIYDVELMVLIGVSGT